LKSCGIFPKISSQYFLKIKYFQSLKRFWSLKQSFQKGISRNPFTIFSTKYFGSSRSHKIFHNILELLSSQYLGNFVFPNLGRVFYEENLWTLFSTCFWDSVQRLFQKPFLNKRLIETLLIGTVTRIYKIKLIDLRLLLSLQMSWKGLFLLFAKTPDLTDSSLFWSPRIILHWGLVPNLYLSEIS